MRKLPLVLMLLIGTVLPSMAQSFTDPIEIKGNKQNTFYQYGNKLSPRQIIYITQENPEATLYMKRAKSNSDLATFFSFTGGMLIGWPVGTMFAGARPNWAIAGIGMGVLVVSLPFNTTYQKHARNAVEVYNEGLGPFVKDPITYKLGVSGNGLGVQMNF
ncbi:hypothetical protein BH23BAC1_BH23BAC1_06020 [soil metagenome]